MVLLRTFSLLAATIASLALSVAGQASNDDPRGKPLYVNYPSCDHYQCKVIWHRGDRVYVNWLAAPKGNVKIELAPQEGTTGLPTYRLTKSTSGLHHSDACDNMGLKGTTCGRFWWNVPDDAVPGKYEIIVTSLSKPDIVGYTDTVVIKPKKKKSGSKRSHLHSSDDE